MKEKEEKEEEVVGSGVGSEVGVLGRFFLPRQCAGAGIGHERLLR